MFSSFVFNPSPFAASHVGGCQHTTMDAFPAVTSRKRKHTGESEDLSAPASAPLDTPRKTSMTARPSDADQVAEFLPLEHDDNLRTLRSLGLLPGQQKAASLFARGDASAMTGTSAQLSSPSSHGGQVFPSINTDAGRGHAHTRNDSDDSVVVSPTDLRINTSVLGGPPLGVLQPQADQSSMEVDGALKHGPHCKSIPQLFVRTLGGTGSELWARCSDCGCSSKVQADGLQTEQLSYSP